VFGPQIFAISNFAGSTVIAAYIKHLS